jgi:hypothetical protein
MLGLGAGYVSLGVATETAFEVKQFDLMAE